MLPLIENRQARRLFQQRQGLLDPPSPKQSKMDLLDLIERIGFVQLDSISTVERAHHMILFARNQTYRRKHLTTLLERDRALFENWTHDASIIPTRFYPYWQTHFIREGERLRQSWRKWRRGDYEAMLAEVLDHVRESGPVLSREMGEGSNEKKGGNGWWDWHPSKTALEYLWRTGALAVARREGFQKVYDLAEQVIPEAHRDVEATPEDLVDWACRNALTRLGFATSGELAAFWGIISPAEAKAWCAEHLGRDFIEVLVESADGSKPRRALAGPEILEELNRLPEAPTRLRALSPFDPMIRDRNRTQRLFGFHYRIEVFVPAAKRRYGYYVFPLLENDRLIGRIDMKCQRRESALAVTGLWLEPGIKPTAGRLRKLEAELERLRKFTGNDRVTFEDGFLKSEPS